MQRTPKAPLPLGEAGVRVPRVTITQITLVPDIGIRFYSSMRGIPSASSTVPTAISPTPSSNSSPTSSASIAARIWEDLELNDGSEEKWLEIFGDAPSYIYIPGLCKAATLKEIEAQGCSLNPGRYVGVAKGEDLSDEDFKEQLEALNEELEVLNAEARELEAKIAENVVELLES